MKPQTHRFRNSLCLLAVVVFSHGIVESMSAQNTSPQKSGTNAPPVVKFRPMTAATGPASVRVTGGSRGTGDKEITLDVLAPDDIGMTTMEQPSLFWFQSKPSAAKFELTLLQENKAKPVVRVEVERSSNAGIQRMKLSDHGVSLSPGVEYQWVVALITDPENRSTDLVASGVIRRIDPAPELKERIGKAAPEAAASLYAEAGIWYDALSVLSDQIQAHPENGTLRETRADLLRQVGLKTAADYEANLAKR
jgi:hypothetical protein